MPDDRSVSAEHRETLPGRSPPFAGIDAVIFDCDGTLVDSERLSMRLLVECVGELGLAVSYEQMLRDHSGNELTVVLEDMEDRLGRPLPDDFVDRFRARQIDLLRRELRATDGAAEVLAGMDRPVCVASNAPMTKIDVCLQTTGLDRFFTPDRVFSAWDIQSWKPSPDLFLHAATALGVPPHRCAVVEDSGFGIQAGLAAGMQVFAYVPERQGGEEQSGGADSVAERPGRTTVIRHLTELRSFLDS